jgi:hypothetical protein
MREVLRSLGQNRTVVLEMVRSPLIRIYVHKRPDGRFVVAVYNWVTGMEKTEVVNKEALRRILRECVVKYAH